jgi:outer membrane protein TolC
MLTLEFARGRVRRGILAAALAFASCAFAQDAPLKLTLADAVKLALKQNPRVVSANLEVARSDQERLIARSGLLPQAGVSATETVRRANLETALGVRFPGVAQHVGPFDVFQAGVGFQAPVFDLTLWRRYRSSQAGVTATRAAETSAREENAILVVSQYLGGERAAAEVEAAQSRVNLAQALYDQAADLQKSGVGTGIDTLRANVQLQNEKQRLIVARTQLETSLYGLAQLIGVEPTRQIELADRVSFFETPPAPPEQTLETAWRTRPEVKELEARQRQAELGILASGDQRLPKFSVNGSWAQAGLSPTSVIPVYEYMFKVELPLFTGGRIKAQRTEAEIQLRQLKEQQRDLRNRITLEVKTAIARLDSARSEVEVANQGVQLAQQEVDQARDRFQAGVANNIEVISAQDALARANDNQIAALYRYNQARADLAHSQGRMEALYSR